MGLQPQINLSGRSRTLALAGAWLGLCQIGFSLATASFSHPGRFLVYAALAGACWLAQRHKWARELRIPLGLPVVLLAIVQLSASEAVLIGSLSALLHSSGGLLRRFYSVGVQAMMIATTCFALDSLMPAAWQYVPVRLLVASGALFVAQTFPSAAAARLSDGQRLGRIWRDSYWWAFPYYVVAAALALLLQRGPTAISWEASLLILPSLLLAVRAYRGRTRQLEAETRHAGDMASLHLRAIESLALAVEAKENPNTAGHLRRVQVYALGIGRRMGLNGPELEALHAAALLHDIGKLAVPDHILAKPGKLTAEEFARLKVHPTVGAEIVEQVRFPYPVAPIVRAHHEKWDGSGYPFGLRGEEIPLGARILSAVDCLDALSSDREYRKAIPLAEAVRQVVAGAGRSFDPAVVKVLESAWQELDLEVRNSAGRSLLSSRTAAVNGAVPDAGLDLPGGSADAGADFLSTIAAARTEEKQFRDLVLQAGGSLDLHETFQRLHDLLKATVRFDALAFFVRRGGALRAEFASGLPEPMVFRLEVPVGEGLTGWTAGRSEAMVNGNPAVDPGFAADPERPLESALSFPLRNASGVVAVLNLYRSGRDAFSRDDLRILSAVAPSISTAISHALQFRLAEDLAQTDPVTGLPGEPQILRLIAEEVSRSRRSQAPFAVALLRLSGPAFPSGQNGEGPVLEQIGRALRHECRDYDHLGYYRHNTFAFILPGMKSADLRAKLTALASASTPLAGSGVDFHGGGAFYPHDGDLPQQLLAIATRRVRVLTVAEAKTDDLVSGMQALSKAIEPIVRSGCEDVKASRS